MSCSRTPFVDRGLFSPAVDLYTTSATDHVIKDQSEKTQVVDQWQKNNQLVSVALKIHIKRQIKFSNLNITQISCSQKQDICQKVNLAILLRYKFSHLIDCKSYKVPGSESWQLEASVSSATQQIFTHQPQNHNYRYNQFGGPTGASPPDRFFGLKGKG